MLVTEQFWSPLTSIVWTEKNIFFYVPQEKESHTSLERHECEKISQNYRITNNSPFNKSAYKEATVQVDTLHNN